jgi:hypothetical protein
MKTYADCLFSFSARQADELSFTPGDIIEIIRSDGSNWLTARDAVGQVGLVPKNYLKLNQTSQKVELLRHQLAPPPIVEEAQEVEEEEIAPQPERSSSPIASEVALPKGWASAVDEESGDTYYYNKRTGEILLNEFGDHLTFTS